MLRPRTLQTRPTRPVRRRAEEAGDGVGMAWGMCDTYPETGAAVLGSSSTCSCERSDSFGQECLMEGKKSPSPWLGRGEKKKKKDRVTHATAQLSIYQWLWVPSYNAHGDALCSHLQTQSPGYKPGRKPSIRDPLFALGMDSQRGSQSKVG